MTEKRFRISQGYTDRFCHDWKKNKLSNFKQTIDCLNELTEENEQLKQENQFWLKTAYHVDTIAHEDRDYAKRMHKQNKQLEKENKELKQRIGGLEDYKEASIKFTQEVEDFFKRHEFDTVNFDLIDIFFDGFEFYSDKCDELKKENKELKQAIKEVLELLKEEVDLFTDEATEHDIKAYIELREFDNKDAYYMATATKKAIKLLKEMVE